MKIDQSNIQQSGAGGAQQAGETQQVRGGQGGSASRSAYGLGSDSVQLSSLSEAVRAHTVQTPERAYALSQISRDVQKGNYQVDAQAVSRALVTDALLP